MSRAVIAAAIAALTLSLSLPALPVLAGTSDSEDRTPPGVADLGIDISRAGGTSASVQQFLAHQMPEAQRAIQDGCKTALANQEEVAVTTVRFCQMAIHG